MMAITKRPAKRGRPRKSGLVISVRLSADAYDVYCLRALASGRRHVRTVIREVLERNAKPVVPTA